jgi:hypothetical protein
MICADTAAASTSLMYYMCEQYAPRIRMRGQRWEQIAFAHAITAGKA